MPQPVYTWQELAEHNKEGSALIAIHGKVYDVTKFLDQHPGGRDQLLLGVGRDSTLVFDSYHKESTLKVLEKFYVGNLITNELPVFPAPNAFYLYTKNKVAEYFKATKQDPKSAPWMLVRYAAIMTTLISCLFIQYMASSLVVAFAAAVFLGLAAAMIGLMPMHDASHFSISHNPIVWRNLGLLHDFFNGSSSRVWAYQHMLGHHPYTNIDDADPDIMTASKEVPDIRRIKPNQTWFSRYLKQHIYVPILYGLLAVKTRVQDLMVLFVLKTDGAIRLNPLPARDCALVLGGKAFFVVYRYIIPLAFAPLWKVVAFNVVNDLVSSWWLALCFQCSHVVAEVVFPQPDKDGKVPMDWAEMQIATTMDYATDSWFWSVATGALNHQTTHHLFPGISQYYYPQITPIVVAACKKFGVKYNYVPTWTEAIGAHIHHLYTLGRDPQMH